MRRLLNQLLAIVQAVVTEVVVGVQADGGGAGCGGRGEWRVE